MKVDKEKAWEDTVTATTSRSCEARYTDHLKNEAPAKAEASFFLLLAIGEKVRGAPR